MQVHSVKPCTHACMLLSEEADHNSTQRYHLADVELSLPHGQLAIRARLPTEALQPLAHAHAEQLLQYACMGPCIGGVLASGIQGG